MKSFYRTSKFVVEIKKQVPTFGTRVKTPAKPWDLVCLATFERSSLKEIYGAPWEDCASLKDKYTSLKNSRRPFSERLDEIHNILDSVKDIVEE